MNIVDFILLGILSFGAYKGYQKGFLLEVVAIVAFILAIIGGFKLLDVGVDILDGFKDSLGNFLPIAAFIVVFVLILVAINLAGRIFKKIIDFTLLGSFDNAAGALLGVFKFALMISIVNWVVINLGIKIPDNISHESSLYPYVVMVGPQVGEVLVAIFPSFGALTAKVGDFLHSLGN